MVLSAMPRHAARRSRRLVSAACRSIAFTMAVSHSCSNQTRSASPSVSLSPPRASSPASALSWLLHLLSLGNIISMSSPSSPPMAPPSSIGRRRVSIAVLPPPLSPRPFVAAGLSSSTTIFRGCRHARRHIYRHVRWVSLHDYAYPGCAHDDHNEPLSASPSENTRVARCAPVGTSMSRGRMPKTLYGGCSTPSPPQRTPESESIDIYTRRGGCGCVHQPPTPLCQHEATPSRVASRVRRIDDHHPRDLQITPDQNLRSAGCGEGGGAQRASSSASSATFAALAPCPNDTTKSRRGSNRPHSVGSGRSCHSSTSADNRTADNTCETMWGKPSVDC